MTYTIGVNLVTFALGLLSILFIYLFVTVFQNVFITFNPKSIARFSILMFLSGFLLPWIIIGDALMIYLIGILVFLMLFYFIWKFRRTRKQSKIQATSSTIQGSDE